VIAPDFAKTLTIEELGPYIRMAERTVATQTGCMAFGGLPIASQRELAPIPFLAEPSKITDGALGHYCNGQSIALCQGLYGMGDTIQLQKQMCRTCPD
jgi:hypothetical protein